MGVEQGRVGEGEQLQGEEVSQPERASSFLPAHTSGTGTRRPTQPPSFAPAGTRLPRPLLGFIGLLRNLRAQTLQTFEVQVEQSTKLLFFVSSSFPTTLNQSLTCYLAWAGAFLLSFSSGFCVGR